MSEEILNKKEIENKFEEYLRKESKDRFYLRKKIGICRLSNNYGSSRYLRKDQTPESAKFCITGV